MIPIQAKRGLIILLTLSVQYTFANKIDKLKSDKDVQRFVTSLDTDMQNHKGGYTFYVFPPDQIYDHTESQAIATEWQIKNWQKADLNNDGLTDLIVHGSWFGDGIFVVMATGKKTFNLFRLCIGDRMPIARPIVIDNSTALMVHFIEPCPKAGGGLIDTLVFKFGGFIERQEQYKPNEIDSVIFSNNGCPMGSCPKYKIMIQGNGDAKYVTSTYIASSKNNGPYHAAGVFMTKPHEYKSQVATTDLKTIIGLVNYTNFKQLSDEYDEPCLFDEGTYDIRVIYKTGEGKQIKVRGNAGTFGLKALNTWFERIQNRQKWKLTNVNNEATDQ